jgi:Uncharacterized conserved protein (DUF2075)
MSEFCICRDCRQHRVVSCAVRIANLSRAEEIPCTNEAPIEITRSLARAKSWSREHARGQRTAGLLASSRAVRLVADGLPPPPMSRDLDAIAQWFLRPPTDYRSGRALETPLSEYGCQGLEIDYAAVCWGNDLIWDDGWIPRKMRAPQWQVIQNPEQRAFRVNSYRVLLTRARARTIVYVPTGSEHDASRAPEEFEGIASALLAAGGLLLDAPLDST